MKKKVLACLMAAALLIGGLAGCGDTGSQTSGADVQTQDQGTDKGQSESSEDQGADASETSKYQTTYGSKMFDDVTITVELFDRSNAPEGSTITDNKWVKYVNQEMNKVGINVEFVTVPRWDEVTKMQTMMASGTAPDLMLTYTYAHAEDYFKQGGTWDLSPFIDGADQAQNLKTYVGEGVLDIGRSTEEQLYGIVARRATTAKSNLFLRKDWLDALGMEIPTTADELYDVIYEMTYNNPDGRNDVIGGIIWNGWNLRMAFSELAGNEKEMAIGGGDSVIGDYYDPGQKAFYQFTNRLYNAKLLNQEYYTMSEDNFKSYIVTGAVGFMEYSVNGSVDVMRGSLLKTLQENVPTADIVSIPPLTNESDGEQYSDAYSEGGLIAFCPLTADEEKVEACMTYLDWMSTEAGGFAIYHGFESEHFEYDDNGVPVVLDAEYNSQDKDWIRADLFAVGNQGYFSTVDEFNACTSKEAPGYEQHVIDNYENALKGKLVYDTTYTSPSQSELTTDLNLIRDEYSVKLTTCTEAEFEALFEEYMQELKAAGIETVINERTEYFTEQYENE